LSESDTLKIAGVVLSAVALIWGVKQVFFNHILNNLLDKKSKKHYKEIIKANHFSTRIDRYRENLASSLDFLDNRVGSNFSFKAFDFSLYLALIYSFMSFFILWLFGASGTIGSIEILPSNSSLADKAISTLIFIFTFLFFYSLGNIRDNTKKILIEKLNISNKIVLEVINLVLIVLIILLVVGVVIGLLIVGEKVGLVGLIIGLGLKIGVGLRVKVAKIIGLIIGIVIGLTGVGVIVVVVGKLSGNLLLLLSFVVVVLLLILVIRGGVIAVVGVLGGVGVLIVISMVGVNMNTIIYFLFFLLLPAINSLFDWLSLSITRYLGYLATESYSRVKLLLLALLDAFLAGVFLIAILKTFETVINYFDIYIYFTYSETRSFFDISQKIKDFFINPFDIDSLWIGAMILTTLIPTLLHLFFVLLKALWIPLIFRDSVVDNLKKNLKSGARVKLSQVALILTIRWIEPLLITIATLAITYIYLLGLFEVGKYFFL